ncbi:MAG: DUF4097 and DUF4098 domain-containing protein YvlB [Paraglaciecola sp.]|jgi:DUF4097 and DUF4098 domain-containing protein YvlB
MSSNIIKISALLLLTTTLSTGCIIHVGGDGHSGEYSGDNNGDISSVLGSLEVGEGKQVGDVSSVNGKVSINEHVSAQDVDTVNGSIEIANHVSVKDVETVNGSIETGHHFMAQGSVSTVNGDINILAYSIVGGDISTVNGDIKLNKVAVTGDISTSSGSITLENNSTVAGDIVYESHNENAWGWNNDQHKLPRLVIDSDSTVEGRIILRQKVSLAIENQQLMDKVEYDYPQQ